MKRRLPTAASIVIAAHSLIPERSTRAEADRSGETLREKLVPLGAEYISVWNAMCNADGCLTRIGEAASDITASDQVHLTEKGSVFLIGSIMDRLLGERALPVSQKTQ